MELERDGLEVTGEPRGLPRPVTVAALAAAWRTGGAARIGALAHVLWAVQARGAGEMPGEVADVLGPAEGTAFLELCGRCLPAAARRWPACASAAPEAGQGSPSGAAGPRGG